MEQLDKTTFTVKKVVENGIELDALVKITETANGLKVEETWTTIKDLDRLFDKCSQKWARYGWDLEKLITCIEECDFE